MKRKLILLVVLLATTFILTSTALACFVTFEPDPLKVGKSGIGSLTVTIKWEHRRCVLDDDDVNIDTVGVKILKKSGWIKIRHGLFRNTMKVKLTAKKKGRIRVWRECRKKGVSEGFLNVIRKAAK